jgi:hypothetical protein
MAFNCVVYAVLPALTFIAVRLGAIGKNVSYNAGNIVWYDYVVSVSTVFNKNAISNYKILAK